MSTSCPLRLALVLLVALLCGGCRNEIVDGHIPPRRSAAGSGQLLAGASRQEITPVPGFPMAGHAIGGKVSRGYWTRLYARAFYFEDAAGTPLAMVACDLWAVPAGLGDRVAEILAGTELDHVGRENLIVAATHTHHSQGNFATATAFNDFAQPQPGFDPHLFEFLAQRIATAVSEAYQRRQPAALHLVERRLPGFFRNRSFEPFLLNREHAEVLEENADLPLCVPAPGFPEPRACRAVDPRVTTLRVTGRESGGLIGLAGFLGVHPTVMTHDLEVYSGDLFGTASILTEQELGGGTIDASAPVVALFNGAEGDITTTWIKQDRRDLMRLAQQLSTALLEMREGGTPLSGEIGYRFEVMPVAGTCFADAAGVQRCTPANGVPGASAFGGAEDGRTVLNNVGFYEGRRGTKRDAHGAKLPAFDLDFGGLRFQLTEWMTGTSGLPTEAPLGVYRLGRLVLATLPGEFTMIMGRRIAAALEQTVTDADHVLLIGLANEYLDYFTTPEEYDLQHYEGGMTMYGQAAGALIGHYLAALAGGFADGDSESAARKYEYNAGGERKYRIADVGSTLYLPDDGQAALLQDLDSGDPRRDFPCACWTEGSRRMKDVLRGEPATASVRIEDAIAKAPLSIAGRIQDDTGVDLVTVVSSATDSTSTWCAFWMAPAGIAIEESVVFRVIGLEGQTLYSAPFDAGSRFRNGCLSLS
ncbi:MAG TPA: neutral/alkaline non-lysosomal ceramidase N-terminal domain-containing protein [Terriglobales bacterium]|nr:neutral/alkaline non-lysosomal ceramidase N-terminal domain-containing protein [Terriglobales bacterium]